MLWEEGDKRGNKWAWLGRKEVFEPSDVEIEDFKKVSRDGHFFLTLKTLVKSGENFDNQN